MSRMTLFNSPLMLGFEHFERTLERIAKHRGIAARQFQRSFVLAEGIEVKAARLDNGLLSIELERPPVETRVRNIAIETPARKNKANGHNLPNAGGKTIDGTGK